jgi:hypothetical protein
MPRVTCRCGEKLKIQPDGPERIDCPKCRAKIRLRRSAPARVRGTADDGYLRFLCPCGRRLKVPTVDRPVAGKCPDCGRVVPVPTSPQATSMMTPARRATLSDPEARTEELNDNDLAQLETWGARYTASLSRPEGSTSTTAGLHAVAVGADIGSASPMMPPTSAVKFEAGLRICPRCKKPVHLGAAICRECGTPVPR